MGGRAAEELILKDVTTGAGNDIERATELARKMVCDWGMSEELGPLSFGKKEEQIFLGREIAQHRDYSEQTAQQIDDEVKKLIAEAYGEAKQILSDNKDVLEAMATTLLEKETLDANEIEEIIRVTKENRGAPPAAEQESAEVSGERI
jgi:cell division protease FtsH